MANPDPNLRKYIDWKIEECAFTILHAYRIQNEARILLSLKEIQAWLDLKELNSADQFIENDPF